MMADWAKFAGFCAVLVVAMVGSLLWALNYPPQNYQWSCERQNSASQNNNGSNSLVFCHPYEAAEKHDEAARANQKGQEDSIKTTDKLLTLFTGLLVLVGGVQAYFLLGTVNATFVAALAAKEGSDAVVAAETGRLLVYPMSHNYWDVAGKYAMLYPNSSETGQALKNPIEVQFWFRNYGKTPATIIKILADVVVTDRPPPDIPPPKKSAIKFEMNELLDLPLETVIAATDDTEAITVKSHQHFALRDAIAVSQGQTAVWFWGGIIYWDVFNRECEQRFAFRLDHTRKGRFIRQYDRTYYRQKDA